MSSFCLIIVVVMVAINAETKQCTIESICKCTQNEACILKCIGDKACIGSSAQLICKSGYPCTIICDSDGNKEACSDNVIDANGATDISLACSGDLACLQTALYCDNSQCSIDCHSGSSDTCKDMDINTMNAVSFNCYNDCSDPSIPNDFSNLTPNPTKSPTRNPTITPTKSPIKTPTTSPSKIPYLSPTPAPTSIPPTPAPTEYHTPTPTKNPTELPTPTNRPTNRPTVALSTSVPTKTSIIANPSITPTRSPIKSPTNNPSVLPTRKLSSITYTTALTKSPATAYPTILSSANPTINPSNVPNESHIISPTKLPSVSPSVSFTKKYILTTTEKSVEESNENDISVTDVVLKKPLWMISVIGFGLVIVCCLLIVLMLYKLCIRKRKKKSYVSFKSPDVNENDKQITVGRDRHGTHSINSIFATIFNDSWNLSSLSDIDNISNITCTCEQIASKQNAKMHDNMDIKLVTIPENNTDKIQVEGPPKIFRHMDEDVVREINQNINQTVGIVENDDMDVVETVNITQMLMEYVDEGQTNKIGTQPIIVNV